MRQIGFSTGCVALGDYRKGMSILHDWNISVVELSALRSSELPSLISGLRSISLASWSYVSVHAPSKYNPGSEPEMVSQLSEIAALGISIVVHPDAICDWNLWTSLGHRVLLENMDKRKSIGRTCDELQLCFDRLPKARLCFDIGHARQIDPSLVEAQKILRAFGDRIEQLHISEVSTTSKHSRISWSAARAFSALAHWIPKRVPVVIESVVREDQIGDEVARASAALGDSLFPGVNSLPFAFR